MKFFSYLLLSACASATAAALRFTGSAAADFGAVPRAVSVADANGEADVVLPAAIVSSLRAQGVRTPASGFDLKRIYFAWEYAKDELSIGIECFGICGDADGDGKDTSND